jgi:signal transduction histidine kinase
VERRNAERLSATAGLVATVAVGAAALFASSPGSTGTDVATNPLWWVAYGSYLAAFLLDTGVVSRRARWTTDRRLLAVEIVAGCTALVAEPDLGWTAVLLVVTAASAAYTLTAPGALVVVLAQSAVVALSIGLDDRSLSEIVLATAVYGSFQGFAVMMVGSERREAAARSELAAAHGELRAATILLAATARTAERLRISRDIHDVMGHQLTALALELEVASHLSDGEGAAHVLRARAIAKELLHEVRTTVGGLRTGVDDLAATLREMVTDLPGLAVDLSVDERAPIDETTALAVVRCVQEIVTNTLRHAGADRLTVAVVVDDAGVRVDAHDDGRGAPELALGHGLTGMRERIEQLGGDVTIQTAAGHGFAVLARVPAS